MSAADRRGSRGQRLAFLASLAILATGRAISADAPAAHFVDPKASMPKAMEQMALSKTGKVAAHLEDLAWRGDARAQLLLGTTYVDGKLVPRDLARGYAWLQVTADGGPWQYFSKGSPEKAREIANQLVRVLSGRELIEADAIAAQVRAELLQRWKDDIERAVRALTGQLPLSAQTVVSSHSTGGVTTEDPAWPNDGTLPGCAAIPSLKGCKMPADFGSQLHCTGVLPALDARASLSGKGAVIGKPTYPAASRRDSVEGLVGMMRHVDYTGWICSVTVSHSSGVPELDQAALEASRRWHVSPAKQAGTPVESLLHAGPTFSILGYSFSTW